MRLVTACFIVNGRVIDGTYVNDKIEENQEHAYCYGLTVQRCIGLALAQHYTTQDSNAFIRVEIRDY